MGSYRLWELEGRKRNPLNIYEKSIVALSDFVRSLGLPGLATMDRTHIRHWLTSLHQRGNKPATISVRYRSLNRCLNWCKSESERSDDPMDRAGPPKIPEEIQAYCQPHQPYEVETVVKAIGRATTHNLRDAAMVMVLCDSGVRAAELCGMKVDDFDWLARPLHHLLLRGQGLTCIRNLPNDCHSHDDSLGYQWSSPTRRSPARGLANRH